MIDSSMKTCKLQWIRVSTKVPRIDSWFTHECHSPSSCHLQNLKFILCYNCEVHQMICNRTGTYFIPLIYIQIYGCVIICKSTAYNAYSMWIAKELSKSTLFQCKDNISQSENHSDNQINIQELHYVNASKRAKDEVWTTYLTNAIWFQQSLQRNHLIQVSSQL